MMIQIKRLILGGAASAAALLTAACATSGTPAVNMALAPATAFDLSEWNITVPTDTDRNQKPDTISVKDMQTYAHPDFFYLDDAGRVVFATPNKAFTTPNSSNTRSELRHMLRGTNTKIKTHGPKNNFVVAARRDAEGFGRIGGRLDATLRVDHVARRAGNPEKAPAYSVVVGQIHAVKEKEQRGNFGYGNEPLKIYYKKFPNHDTGSVFWTYERNLAKDDPDRTDIAYAVWGNTWDNPADPGAQGLPLGEDFSYTVNVYENTMYLRFENPRLGVKTFSLNLSNNRDAFGNVDSKDNEYSYAGDQNYFKAGAYNQCSTKDDPGFWYAACPGTGEWATDKANGDYAQVSFSKLTVGPPTPQ